MSKVNQKAVARPVCPLFPSHEPPVFAEEVGAISVYRNKIQRGQSNPGRLVDFEDDNFIEAHGGVLEIDPFTTTEKDISRVLKADVLKKGETDEYWIIAVDQNNTKLATRRFVADVDMFDERDKGDDEDDDDDDDDDAGVKAPMTQHLDGTAEMSRALLEENRRYAREARRQPMEMFQLITALNSQKERPDAVVDALREELRALRVRHEDELRQTRMARDQDVAKAQEARDREVRVLQETKDREIRALQDELREERRRAEKREDELRSELRDIRKRSDDEVRVVREKTDQNFSSMRNDLQKQIYHLQEENIRLQREANMSLLQTNKELMEARMAAQLAQNEMEDAESALEQAQQALSEQERIPVPEEAMPGWLKPFAPYIPMALNMLRANGQAVPQLPQQVQQYVEQQTGIPVLQPDPIQLPVQTPIQPPPIAQVAAPIFSQSVQSAPVIQPEIFENPTPEDSNESEDEVEAASEESEKEPVEKEAV